MSNTKIFWGTFLISIGTLLLFFQFDWIDGGLGFIFNLWPLLIIVWGVSLLKIAPVFKKMLVALSAILLSIFIFALFSAGNNVVDKVKCWGGSCSNVRIYKSDHVFDQKYILDYDSTMHDILKFEMDAGAGKYILGDVTDELVSVYANGVFSDVSLNYLEQEKKLSLDFDGGGDMSIKIDDDGFKREGIIALNPNVLWDIDIDVGAASLDADLRKYKVRELEIESGAAGVDIKIGELAEEVKIFIDAGASSICISIPDDFGCEIEENVSLSGIHFDGFSKGDNGSYKTENFEKAERRIYISIDGGVSDFKIARYK